MDQCPNVREAPRPCRRVRVASVGALTGQFSFAILLHAEKIEDIHTFIVKCLKGSAYAPYVEDTQTFAGRRLRGAP
jgi:hypothetical protein